MSVFNFMDAEEMRPTPRSVRHQQDQFGRLSKGLAKTAASVALGALLGPVGAAGSASDTALDAGIVNFAKSLGLK